METTPNKYRVVVAGHDQKFFHGLQQALEETGLFEFREDFWSGHDRHDEQKSKKLLDWADIIIAEWCLGNAVWYSHHKRDDQHMVIRFHLQERHTPFPGKVNLEVVHKILFVGPHIEREAQKTFAFPPSKTSVLPNFVDFSWYNRPKYPGAEFNLGIIGIAPKRKRFDRAVDLLVELKKLDDRYTLHIKGHHPSQYPWLWKQDAEREYYLREFKKINSLSIHNSIVFDPPGNDIPDWFRCIGCILSPSDFESFHMAVAEGMCSGTQPIVWDWEGASEIYTCIETVTSTQEAADHIHTFNVTGENLPKADQLQNYIRQKFDRDIVRDKWLKVLLPQEENLHLFRPKHRQNQADVTKLIVVHAIDNLSTFHRREMLEALADNLKGQASLLIIEPGSHYNQILSLKWESEKNLSRYARWQPLQESENIFRFRSLVSIPSNVSPFPFPIDNTHASRRRILQQQIRYMFPNAHSVIHWIYKPEQREMWTMPEDRLVYECYDDYTRDFGTGELFEDIVTEEQRTMQAANVTFFTSTYLLESKAHHARHYHLTENGVNFSAFAKYFRAVPHTKAPVKVGYLGNLSHFFDWNTMLAVVTRLAHYEFYFCGQIEQERLGENLAIMQQIAKLPNCYFTGRVERDEGAQLIADHDALIIPFIQNEAMDAVNPLKLWEYLATGNPVVSSPMKAIMQYDSIIDFASTPEEWVNLLCFAVASDTQKLRQKRIFFAKTHSWNDVCNNYRDVLCSLLKD